MADFDLGSLVVYLEGEMSDFMKTMDAAVKETKKFQEVADEVAAVGKKLTIAGAAISGPIFGAAKAYGSMGQELKQMSIRTSIGVEALTEFAYAMDVSGASIESFETGLRFMQRSLNELSGGGKEIKKTFHKLGIPFKALKGLSPEMQFEVIGDAIRKIQDPAKRTAVTMELFGRGSTNLLPIILKGSLEMEKMRQEARDLGLVLSTEDVEAADKFNDVLDTLWRSIKIMVFSVGQEAVPVVKEWAMWIVNSVRTVRGFVREHGALIRTVLILGIALTSLSTILITLGTTMKILLSTFTMAKGLLTALGTSFLGAASWVAILLLVGTSVAFVTDSLLNLFGVCNLGLVDMVGNFRIGGFKISTYMSAAWLQILKIWEMVKLSIAVSWQGLILIIQNLGGVIYRTMLRVAEGIAMAFWKTVEVIARAIDWLASQGGMDTNLAGGAARQKRMAGQNYAGLIQESINAEKDRTKEYNLSIGERQNQVDIYDKAMSNLFLEDMKEAKKQVQEASKSVGAVTDPGRISKTNFKEVSLNRFSLSSPAGAGKTEFQVVRAPGTEEKLQTLIDVIRKKPNGIVLQ